MAQAIMVRTLGGPDVLKIEGITLSAPGPGEVQIRQVAVGVNFIDVYFRTGLYKSAEGLPFIPGEEGAGIVTAVGDNVSSFSVGDRVAYASSDGAYASERNIEISQLVKVPDGYHARDRSGDDAEGHDGAIPAQPDLQGRSPDHTSVSRGGRRRRPDCRPMGQGARRHCYRNRGPQDKIELALAHGYDHIINYRTDNFVARSRRSPAARASMSSMIPSARTPIRLSLDCLKPLRLLGQLRSIPPVRSKVQHRRSLRRRARCLRRARRCSAMLPRAPSWRPVQTRCLMLCKATKCVSISTRPMRLPTQAQAHADLEA
jgi:NADPH2:quinone reductase